MQISAYAEEILKWVEQIENCQKETAKLQGSLKVALPETLLTHRMQPVLKTFRQRAPDVRISVQSLNCYRIRDEVTAGNLDLGAHYDAGGYHASLIVRPVAAFPRTLIGSPETNLSLMGPPEENRQKHLSLITNDRDSIFQGIRERYLRGQGIVLENMMDLNSIETIKRCVESNLGIAIVPRYAAQAEIDAGKVREIPSEISQKKITAVYSYHKNKWITPAMALFIQLTQEYLGNGDWEKDIHTSKKEMHLVHLLFTLFFEIQSFFVRLLEFTIFPPSIIRFTPVIQRASLGEQRKQMAPAISSAEPTPSG